MLTSKILMVRPRGFRANSETADDNPFQKSVLKVDKNLIEYQFDELVNLISEAGIDVQIYDPPDDTTPDGVFPNNWFSTFPTGELILYPMKAENRRSERRQDLIDQLSAKYKTVHDLSYLEHSGQFLEGSGSLVIDHDRKQAFASISYRTSASAIEEWKKITGYDCVTFQSADKNNHILYHTNVMMTLGEKFAIICLKSIPNLNDRKTVSEILQNSGREIIEIGMDQLNRFCGNCLEIENKAKEKILIMSETAFAAFTDAQIKKLIPYAKIISSDLSLFEDAGGGSARCMIAELF